MSEQGNQGLQGAQGQRGRPGQEGRPGAPGISAGTRRAAGALLVLVLLVGAGNLVASYDQVQSFKNQLREQQAAEQKAAGREVGKLCRTFGELAANQPPAGSAKANPSRAYEQRNHKILDGVGPDIGCGK